MSPAAALSAPTITTTLAEPASAVTAASIGCTWVTDEGARRRASRFAPDGPLAYSTTVALVRRPAGVRSAGVACE